MSKIEQRLSYAFLLNASVIRDSERTTAEEVRMTAQELQDSLGGIYGVLSQEFQLPLVKRKLALLNKTKKLPELPKGCLLYTSPSPRDGLLSRMPSSA